MKFPRKELYEIGFQYYEPDDVYRWLKLCIEDYPVYPDKTENLYEVVVERHRWFMRWFTEFMKDDDIFEDDEK